MKTRVIRTAITELDENEAFDLTQGIKAFTDDSLNRMTSPAPTDRQIAIMRLFAAQMEETLG